MHRHGRRPRVALLLSIALASCIASPVAMPTIHPVRNAVSLSALPSGMQTVFERAPDFGVAGVVLSVGAGSADEPAEQQGLAHLVEHLVFLGRHRGTTFKDRLREVGVGDDNAFTGWDATTYYAFGSPSIVTPVVSLFADMLDDPLAGVDAAAFEHERRIVRDEMRLRTENGTPGQALGILAAQVFPADDPYARPTVGTEDSIDRLTLDDAREFARTHYRPNVCVLTVSSPTPIDEEGATVAQIVAAHMWPAATVATRVASAREDIALSAGTNGWTERALPVAGPLLYVGWPIPSEAAGGADAAILLASMVYDTFLFHVDDRDRDIASVSAHVQSGARASMFYVAATLNEGSDPKAAAASLLHMLHRGWGEEIYVRNALEAYRRAAAASLVAEEEPIGSRVLHLAESTRLTGDPGYLGSRAERTIGLSSSDLAAFYHLHLVADRAHVLFVSPGTTTSGTGRRATPSGDEADFGLKAQKVADLASEDVRSWMRAPGVARARQTTLPNGLEVVVLPRPGATFHTVVLAYHGGKADEQVLGAAVASLWAKEHHNWAADAWGVQYSDGVEGDLTREVLHAAGSDLKLTLKELSSENEFHVFWPPRTFTAKVESFEREDESAPRRFEREVTTALFGSHPYGRMTTSKELRAVNARDVYGFLDEIRRPNNGIAVVVGDFDPDAAMQLVVSELGSLGNPNAPTKKPHAAPPSLERAAAASGRHILVEDRPGSTDAKLEFRCVLPKADQTWSGAYSIFSAAVGEGIQGDFRERTATSYTMSADAAVQRGGTATFELSGHIDEARLGYAVRRLRRFVEEPMATFIDDRTFLWARGDVARSLDLSLDGTESLAELIASAWNRGLPLEELDRIPERIASTTRDDVLRLAEHCRNNWVLGLLGDEGRIREALAGWSP